MKIKSKKCLHTYKWGIIQADNLELILIIFNTIFLQMFFIFYFIFFSHNFSRKGFLGKKKITITSHTLKINFWVELFYQNLITLETNQKTHLQIFFYPKNITQTYLIKYLPIKANQNIYP